MLGSLIGAMSSIFDTNADIYLTNKTNEQNKELMYQSWAREDNAVQRRVADLKAAGLSPTLAAGSAAASSGPISLKTPKVNTLAAVQAFKQLESEEVSIENAKKTGELIQKQIDNYGLPDWAIALKEAFGADAFFKFIRDFGTNLFDKLFGEGFSFPWSNGGSGSGSSGSDYNFNPNNVIMPQWFMSNAPGDSGYKMPAEYRKGFKFTTVPKKDWEKPGVLEQIKTNSTNAAVRNAIGEDMYKDLMYFIDLFKDTDLSMNQIKVFITGIANRYNVSYAYVKRYWDKLSNE